MSDEFEFGGIQESPIPDIFEEPEADISPPQENDFDEGGVAEKAAEGAEPSEESGGPIVPSGRPPVQRRRPPSMEAGGATGVPDPSRPVQRPQRQQRNYDAAASSGARQVRTQQMHQGFSQPGQSVEGGVPAQGAQRSAPVQGGQRQPVQQGQPGQAPRQRKPLPTMQQPTQSDEEIWGQTAQPQQEIPQQAPQQGGKKSKFGRNKAPKQPKPPKAGKGQRGRQQGVPPQGYGPQGMPPQGYGPQGGGGGRPPKKKGGILPIILIVVAVIAVGLVAFKFLHKKPLEPVVQNYETSGRFALDKLKSELNNYRPEGIDGVVGTEEGDSYLAQEWSYVNNVKIRQEFLQTVGALVQFEYPKSQQMSTTGVGMTDENGNPIMVESYMNNGEEFTVTIPDYTKLAQTMDEKADYIKQMLESSRFSENDYQWVDELTNLMLQFVLDDGPIPTKTVPCSLTIRLGVDGTPYIENDAALDDLLFGSEDFHYMQAKFSQICYGWTGYIEEVYLTYENQHNEEYDRWLELFLAYFEADGGVYDPDGDPQFTNVQKAFKRNRSKWEPWYLRDDNNVIQKYPDGTYIVNYFSVKDENGNDWIQPAAEVEVEIENTRQLEDPWEEETGIWYNWLGMHFLESYDGKGQVITRVGDGTKDHPAGIGTTIITKVLCTDGMYHDVKVALMGYWTGQSAIDYAEKFSSRNRGFTTASVVQLICYEVYVENLELEPIEFESSEMVLTDRNSNISSRTGTMYDFTGVVRLEGHSDKNDLDCTILNDWATSTELAQKYVCWGKSFGRRFNMVYFDCLAGTGDIPSYSAYKQFTGQSSMDEEITG